ncbi:MAG: hypothetical protein DHS20C16_08710 [Phycisphaerae bacterium]|nr:MAG: hypothetical protein DHS20C16_08710 [Phycisphaerae bacterium]
MQEMNASRGSTIEAHRRSSAGLACPRIEFARDHLRTDESLDLKAAACIPQIGSDLRSDMQLAQRDLQIGTTNRAVHETNPGSTDECMAEGCRVSEE